MNLLKTMVNLLSAHPQFVHTRADTSHILQFVHSNTSHARGLGFIMIKIVVRHCAVNPVDPVQPA